MKSDKTLSIGSDHGGYALKAELVKLLENDGFKVLDVGTFGTESVDYPDFAKKACDLVKGGKADFGVLVCTSGIGMSIAANKIRGIRAALCMNLDAAKFSRLHNNANVVCIGAKYFEGSAVPLQIVETFSATQFEGGRHARRVEKFMAFENED